MAAGGPESLLREFNGGTDGCQEIFADQDPSAECFCQVARNQGCSGRRCSCEIACPAGLNQAAVWRHPASVSFKSDQHAMGCSGASDAIITVSKSYFANLEGMKNGCPDRMVDLLTEMVLGGFMAYQQTAGPGAVRHCIKGPNTPGPQWLHVTTFCADGELDRMPSSTRFNWCTTMTDESQAQWVATLAVVWAGGPYNLPPPVPDRPEVESPLAASRSGGLGSCKEVGCGNHRPEPECSCNAACLRYGDCCQDYGSVCEAGGNFTAGPQCSFKYTAGASGPLCFCQLAGNPGCANQRCACDQGCAGSALLGNDGQSVTFINIHEARGCAGPPAALLTIPKSFYSNIQALKAKCALGMPSLLAAMLRSSFETYQSKVAQGPVSQCIHAANSVSVDWLHIHTFCPGGGMDNLPSSARIGWCGTMYSSADAEALANAIVGWAGR